MYAKATVSMIALALTLTFASVSEARQNRGGSNSTTASTTTASTDIRLRAQAEDKTDPALAAADLAPEFHLDYRFKKGHPQIQVRVENFEAGSMFDVFIENLKIGSVTVVLQADGELEGELDFKNGSWPAGLPTTLTAGMMVRIVQGATVIFQAPLQAK